MLRPASLRAGDRAQQADLAADCEREVQQHSALLHGSLLEGLSHAAARPGQRAHQHRRSSHNVPCRQQPVGLPTGSARW